MEAKTFSEKEKSMRKFRMVLLVLAVAVLVCGFVACNKDGDLPSPVIVHDEDSGLDLQKNEIYATNENGDRVVTNVYYSVVGADEEIKELVIPSSIGEDEIEIRKIADKAFWNCTSLTSVTIEDGVKSIGEKAFRNCVNLTTVSIPASVTEIKDKAFELCTKTEQFTVAIGNPNYSSKNGCLIGYETRSGVKCEVLLHGTTSGTLPSGVTIIGEEAFYGFEFAHSLTFATITEIGAGAFRDARFKDGKVTIDCGGDVTIGERAFLNSNVKTFEVEGYITAIGDNAFRGCTELTSITVPDSVTCIGDYAFYGCTGLTSATIGGGVTSIGRHAFNGCTELTNVTFEDASNWYRTTNSSNWSNKTGGTEVVVTGSFANATYFTDTYDYCYWYKL